MRYLFLICINVCCFCDHPKAQAPYLYFNKITTQNGLSHNKVNCILQDRRGFIWLGTDDGLNRYDGRYFTIFRNQPNNNASVSGNIITDMLEDEDQVLWISTADGGITKYDYRLPPSRQFKQYKHLPKDSSSIPVNIINALLQDSSGYLWLASGLNSVLRFDKTTGRFIAPVTKGTRNVLDLCIDKNGILWAGKQGGGILKVNPKNLSYEMDERYTNLYAKLPHVTVSSLFRDKADNVWYGSWDKILYRYNVQTNNEESFTNRGEFSFPNDDILAFAQDASGRLWMGGRYNGLTLYDSKNNRFYNYRYDVARDGTIADNHVNCVFIDRAGMVWIGTNKGVSVYDPSQQSFVQNFLPTANKNINIYDFYTDKNKRLWLGTSEGLFIRSAEDDQFEKRKILFKGNPLSVTKIFENSDGTIYLGTNFSLFRYDAVNNKVSLLPNGDNDKVVYNIISSSIVSIVKDTIDRHPAILTSPYGHFLAYYDFTEQHWVSRTDTIKKLLARFNLKENLVRKIYKSSSGTVWLANGKFGLGEWDKNKTPFVKYYQNDPANPSSVSNNNVYDIAEDAKRNLWISTYGGGLNYFDTKSHTATHINVSNNLLEGLQVDDRGSVWMISNGNLNKYDPIEKVNTSFILPDLEKSGGVSRNIYKGPDSNLYVAGTNYYIRFDPRTIKQVTAQQPMLFTDFKIFTASHSDLLFEKHIELGYNQNFFTIEFSSPGFFKGKPDYSFMLQGYDKDWVEAGERNFANYSNLSAGDYTFMVRGTDRKGSGDSKFATIKITIIPPFWKTFWFYLLCAIVVCAGVYAFYRYRINELLHRQAIRNKIAQDLHDSVGSTLSSITVYSQVAKIQQENGNLEVLKEVVQKISTTSADMISEMNDIVWAINPRNDTMEKILQRMESFASPILQAKNIAFQLQYDPAVLQVNLSMEQRNNFYLIFKEAVNNALKFSGAGKLEVNIQLVYRTLIFTAIDNGEGFDNVQMKILAAKSLSGNGLNNMKRRAAQMNGDCVIESSPGKGTIVRLSFKVG